MSITAFRVTNSKNSTYNLGADSLDLFSGNCMKEIIIYLIATIAAITIFGYSIHMFIGGFVDPQTEKMIIATGCVIAAGVIGLLAWDVVKKRRGI